MPRRILCKSVKIISSGSSTDERLSYVNFKHLHTKKIISSGSSTDERCTLLDRCAQQVGCFYCCRCCCCCCRCCGIELKERESCGLRWTPMDGAKASSPR